VNTVSSTVCGFLFITLGCLCIISATFISNRIIAKIIIRTKKVSSEAEYIKRERIVIMLLGILGLVYGLTIFKNGLSSSIIFYILMLLIVFVGCHYRDKYLVK
jgi:hypothetical protein